MSAPSDGSFSAGSLTTIAAVRMLAWDLALPIPRPTESWLRMVTHCPRLIESSRHRFWAVSITSIASNRRRRYRDGVLYHCEHRSTQLLRSRGVSVRLGRALGQYGFRGPTLGV